MAIRGSLNYPHNFCYICGDFAIKKQQRNITEFVKKVFYAYFGLKLGGQGKS
jgi:hypothetical protein